MTFSLLLSLSIAFLLVVYLPASAFVPLIASSSRRSSSQDGPGQVHSIYFDNHKLYRHINRSHRCCRHRHQPLQSALSPQQQGGGGEQQQALSGLVGDMLSHYQAQAEEIKAVSQAQAAAAATTGGGRNLPLPDQYGIYRIVHQNQLQ